ncbi:hypothetical protein LEP1GSC068_3468 [Leptospira sp. Fiocruz LV3954]|nr:hypothetical protein LEP1GSC068_3468 [Leptospira sp. Fiocruz LV3954]
MAPFPDLKNAGYMQDLQSHKTRKPTEGTTHLYGIGDHSF